MQKKVFNFLVSLYRYSFIKITRQTLVMLFPIALIGTITKMVLKAVLEPDGFIYNIAFLGNIPPTILRALQYLLTSISQMTLGLISVYAVYMAGKFTAKLYRRDGKFAGITGVITLLLISYRYGRTPGNVSLQFYQRLLGGNSLLIALVIGYAIGHLYRWLTPPKQGEFTNSLRLLQIRSFRVVKPLMIAIIIGVVISGAINSSSFYQVWSKTYTTMVTTSQGHRQLWLTILAIIGITVMDWAGVGVPYNYTALATGDAFTANLNYALAHGSAWNVPYKFLGSSLYNSFANFGGDGLILALIVAILLTSNNSYTHRVARWTALPTLFNFNYATMIGLPIILNPFLLLPFIFMPIINILLASGAIALHLIPSTPYPILQGTPGPLISFLGTNGNWWMLVFTIVLLLIDIAVYIPFVKAALKAEKLIVATEESERR